MFPCGRHVRVCALAHHCCPPRPRTSGPPWPCLRSGNALSRLATTVQWLQRIGSGLASVAVRILARVVGDNVRELLDTMHGRASAESPPPVAKVGAWMAPCGWVRAKQRGALSRHAQLARVVLTLLVLSEFAAVPLLCRCCAAAVPLLCRCCCAAAVPLLCRCYAGTACVHLWSLLHPGIAACVLCTRVLFMPRARPGEPAR